jgi:uncharacterized damage-inducible protein DinB
VQDLLELYRHNAWANRNVFDLVQGVDPALLSMVAPGTRDTLLGTLAHLVRVEEAYRLMIQRIPQATLGSNEEYMAHDIDWFATRIQDIGDEFVRLLEASAPESFAFDLGIPWFDFPVSAHEGLRQVLSHSAQHRSQVLSWLSAQGISTPDLDYVLMLRERHAAGDPRT